MGLGASQQCVIIGCNIFVKSFSELQNHSNISKHIFNVSLKKYNFLFAKIGIKLVGRFLKPKTPPNKGF